MKKYALITGLVLTALLVPKHAHALKVLREAFTRSDLAYGDLQDDYEIRFNGNLQYTIVLSKGTKVFDNKDGTYSGVGLDKSFLGKHVQLKIRQEVFPVYPISDAKGVDLQFKCEQNT